MLRINLRDGEKVVINGAVLRSVGRTDILIENEAAILRGRDVISPEEADTPAKRLYFACMMAYIDPDRLIQHQSRVLALFEELLHALEAPEAKASCIAFANKIARCSFYHALADCRDLIAYEAQALARFTPAHAV